MFCHGLYNLSVGDVVGTTLYRYGDYEGRNVRIDEIQDDFDYRYRIFYGLVICRTGKPGKPGKQRVTFTQNEIRTSEIGTLLDTVTAA